MSPRNQAREPGGDRRPFPTSVVITGQKDSLNIGNMLMVLGLVEGLRRRHPGLSLALLSDDPGMDRVRYDSIPGLEIVPRPWRVSGRGRVAAAVTAGLHLGWVLLGRSLEMAFRGRLAWPWGRAALAFRESGASVDVSGDDLTGAYGPASTVQVLYELLTARLLGCRTALLAQSAGPFRGRPGRLAARWADRLTDLVTFRDPTSPGEWAEAVPNGEGAEATADLIHLGGWPPPGPYSEGGPVVVNTGRYTWEAMRRSARRAGERASQDGHLVRWSELLTRLHETSSREVLLLPHVFRPGLGDDRFFLGRILARCPPRLPVRLADEVMLPGRVREMVSGASFVLSSRLHLGLTALRCGVPCLALAYSHKYGALDSPEAVVDLREAGEEELFRVIGDRFAELWTRRVELRGEALRLAAAARERAERNLDLLVEAFDLDGRGRRG